MKKSPQRVAVVTADLAGSSGYNAINRKKIDDAIRQAFDDAGQVYRQAIHRKLAFRVTAGDEFQFVVKDVPRVLEILTYLRSVVAGAKIQPGIRFRAAIGVGEITVGDHDNTYELDGTAFVRAREGLEDLAGRRSPRRWTRLITGSTEIDGPAEAVLSLADVLFERWTIPQWEAVRWSIRGLKREEIARKLRIAHQNVTKRIGASGWASLEPSLQYLGGILTQ